MNFNMLIVTCLAVLAFGASACSKNAESKAPAAPVSPATAPEQEQTAPAPPPAASPDGTGDAAALPPGITAADKEVGDQAMIMFEAMANVAEKNQDDCDTMATELEQVVGANKDLMAKVKVMEQDATKKQWLEDAYSQQAMDIVGRMMDGMQNCMPHPGVQEVFKKLGEG